MRRVMKRMLAILIVLTLALPTSSLAMTPETPASDEETPVISAGLEESAEEALAMNDEGDEYIEVDENEETAVPESESEPSADEPESSADEPESLADDPDASADEPESSADEPESSANEPESSADDPEASADDPEAVTEGVMEEVIETAPDQETVNEPRYDADGDTEQCTVSFDANGGSGTMADQVVEKDSSFTPECGFTAPDGYGFIGWVDENGFFYSDGEPITVTGDMTLTAQWDMTWSSLAAYIAGIRHTTHPIVLIKDVAGTEADSSIVINQGKHIFIDLNGHTLDGSAVNNTTAIAVTGQNTRLTIFDNGDSGGGKLIGASQAGVSVTQRATVELRGGTITGSTCGIYMQSNPTLILGGGTITGNEVYGVYCPNSANIQVSGNPMVTENGTNVYLPSGMMFNVAGELDESARIGFFTQYEPSDEPIVITSGLSGSGTAENFVSDRPEYPVQINAQGEAFIGTPIPDTRVIGVTGSFNDKIKLNYYFDFPQAVLNDEHAYAEIIKESSEEVTINRQYVRNLSFDEEKGGYKISILLAAKEASDTITVKIYDRHGIPLTVKGEKSGIDYTESGVQYSLMQYFDWLEHEGQDENEKAVGAAAKDYCAAVQIYFDCNADNLTVSNAVDAVNVDELSSYIARREGTLPDGMSIKGISAILDSNNLFRLYFGFKNVDPNGFTYTIGRNRTHIKSRSDGACYLALDEGVYSNHLQDAYTYSVSDGTNTYKITASVLTYARALAIKTNKKESDLGKALYLYNRAAVDAFGD